MFKQTLTKILKKGGEEKMKTLKFVIALLMVLGLAAPCFAAATVGPITISAVVPTLTQSMTAKIFEITPGATDPDPDVWNLTPVASMSGFGLLTRDTTNNIFKAGKFYAVDVSVVDNSGTEWYIAVSKADVKRGTTTDTLNSNINVTYKKCVKSGEFTVETDIPGAPTKVTFANSAVAASILTKTKLSGGWLRIYYGIATGRTIGTPDKIDAPGASPIGLERIAGTYTGSVTFTLAP